ncbi:hypothetical protein ROZALSC1DRAFT_24489 [Rozella allomycis CSF55]|uniref:SPRY domain-containing protein n=1 Tax=Rozella allomycis (strain CSF55) TaxID=988480 RepID=A0A4P9YE24_ROZAC|nr:hypothetical protein ROZALSC1DRAFT_24489 [Rozella allomycis CSF55]
MPEFAPSEKQNYLKSSIKSEWPPLKEGIFNVEMDILENSHIEFFLNGKSLGLAFAPIYRGKYYAASSLFGGAKVELSYKMDFGLEEAKIIFPNIFKKYYKMINCFTFRMHISQ